MGQGGRPAPQDSRASWRRSAFLIALAGATIAGPVARAAAAEEHTLKLRMSTTLTMDANVFRLPASADLQPVLGKSSKSDEIKATSVGIRFDKAYAQQRLQFELTGTAYRYNNFSFLNFDAFEYRGAWLWHLSPRWSGTLSSERHQSLTSFADYRSFQRNLRSDDAHRFDLDGQVSGGWHVRAAASQTESKNSAIFLEQWDHRSTAGEAGLKYLARSGSWVSLAQRATRGEYLNRALNPFSFFDNKFSQTDTELRANWIASGKSTLTGRLTWLDRRHEHYAERNFSGAAGRLEYVWLPTGKLQLKLSASRDIAFWWDATSSYYVNDTLAIAPTWRPSARTALYLSLNRSVQDFRGPVVPVAGSLRSDTLRSEQLGVDWLPLRNVTLSASVQHSRRGSTLAALEFDDTIAGVTLLLTFF